MAQRGQNRSTAVMNRRVEAPESLDYFPTPPWATRALCRHILEPADWLSRSVWEPACGEGHMARPLGEFFDLCMASDIYPYGHGAICDFLGGLHQAEHAPADWIVTNPPFNLGEAFVLRALSLARCGVAIFCRTNFAESEGRYTRLFTPYPTSAEAIFVERVNIVKGRLDRRASNATSYSWFVWRRDHVGPTLRLRVPPCRAALERDEDYPVAPTEPLELFAEAC